MLENQHEILRLAKRGNRYAQQSIFLSYQEGMLRLCSSIVGEQSAAEDVLQDAFIKVFSKLSSVKDHHRLAGWIKRIVVNESLDYVKHIRYYDQIDDVNVSVEDVNDDEWYRDFSFQIIQQEIEKLPKGCREIFKLRLIEEFKHKEIAEMLSLSESTVKSQYQYALNILQTKLKKYEQV